jgi:hypothetical protein
MKSLNCVISSLALAAMLTACGGSADSVNGVNLTKYLGSWIQCSSTGPATSQAETLTISQGEGDLLAFADSTTSYASAGCTGTVTVTVGVTGSLLFTGTTTIGGQSVDKVIITENGPQMQVLLVLGEGTATATLTPGIPASAGGMVDSEGYPTALSPTVVYTRQF